MALRAGYYGLKKKFIDKVNKWDQIVFPRSEQTVLGAKNRLPFVTPNNTDLNGVTYSYDENGLKLNGTVNIDTYFNYTVAKFSDMPDIVGKTITISLEGNQSNDFMFLQIHHYDGTSQKAVYVNGNELTFTVTEAALSDSNSGLYLQIPAGHSGYQFNNFVVKPMIRDSADPDPTYAPYAMTNRELTEKVNNFTTKTLPNNADLNNYLSEGDYICDANTNTYTNIPPSANSVSFRLKIMPFNVSASRCVQIIIVNKAEPEVYMRTNFGGTWQSWYKFTGTVVS